MVSNMGKLKNNFGFTMVDLLISAVIIIILFSFVLANFRSQDKYKDLERTSAIVLSELRGMQIMSKAGQLIGICSGSTALCIEDGDCVPSDPGSCVDTSPLGGFGVEISACLPGACIYKTIAFDDDQLPIPDDSNVLREFELPGENFFSSVHYSSKEPVDGICPPSDLAPITNFQVTFPTSAQAATLKFDLTPAPSSVVAIIKNAKTNQQRCIFFSRASGLIGEFKIE